MKVLTHFGLIFICSLSHPKTHADTRLTSDRQKDQSNQTSVNTRPPECRTTAPLSPLLVGIVSIEIGCRSYFDWQLRSGGLLVSFRTPTPYLRTSVGLTFPQKTSSPEQNSQPEWQIVQNLKYVYVPEKSFEFSSSDFKNKPIFLPSMQQWSIFLDSEVSLEFQKILPGGSFQPTMWGIKIWQTIPAQWRSLGALRDTRNNEVNGYQITTKYQSKSWSAYLGLGRMNVAIDRISLNLIHPTVEFEASLGELW